MIAVNALIDWLEQHPSVDGTPLVGWRFEMVEGQGVRSGVRDSQLGGPYEGPAVATRLGGSLELHWADGLLTRAGLDRRAVADPASELAAWRADAVQERTDRLPPLAGPTVLPAVETFDPSLAQAVGAGSSVLPRTLRALTDGSLSAGVRRVDAVMRASHSTRAVATSGGFRADWHETSCSIELWADETTGGAYSRRCLPTDADLDRLAGDVAHVAQQIRTHSPLPASARGVLYMPSVVQDLLGRLLLPNLAGRAIRDGRSPFSRADLEAGRLVLRADLDLVVDTTLPLELATAPCSPEGVPAGRVALIASGRLVSPLLDPATAVDFGLPPTPAPRGRPSVLLASALPLLDVGAALALLGDGVVVRALPGLHTQQPRRGSYALVVPDAQAVIQGEAAGLCSVRLAGNLLSHLTQPSTRLVRLPGDLGVGLLVLTDVELLPA